MRKWFLYLTIFLIVLLTWQISLFYQAAAEPKDVSFQRAVSMLEENEEIASVSDVDFYNGTESYVVVQAFDHNQEEVIFWIQEGQDGEYISRSANDGLSENEVKQFVMKKLAPKKLISIKLGVENQLPVYEITYINQKNERSYYYMTFKEGVFVKRYHLKNVE